MIEKLEVGKQVEGVAKATIRLQLAYKKSVHTITPDNGTEFLKHQVIEKSPMLDFILPTLTPRGRGG